MQRLSSSVYAVPSVESYYSYHPAFDSLLSQSVPTTSGQHTGAQASEAKRKVSGEAKPLALVVDDVADVTDMLSVFLSHAGYEVVVADSAAAALAAARTMQFDVIVSDIGMPEMNGYELARALRAMPGYHLVPMIAVTGFSMYNDRGRALESGFNAHLTKPIDLGILFQLIEQLRG